MSQPGRSRSPQAPAAAAPASSSSPAAALGTSPASNALPEPTGPEAHHDEAEPLSASAPPPPPPFEPLFTLLTNSTTNTTVHPRVHYVFSDDDPGVMASAAADPSHRALVVDLVPAPQQSPPKTTSESVAGREGANSGDTSGWNIAWASSLSPDFAVTGSQLAVQQHGAEGGGALMLRVEGVEREPVEVNSGDAGGGSSGSLRNSGSGTVPSGGREDVDALLDDFRRRMDLLRKVVGEGDRRREALDAHAEDHQEHQEEQQEQPPAQEGGDKAIPENEGKAAEKD